MQGLKVVVDVPDARAKVYSRNVRWLASAWWSQAHDRDEADRERLTVAHNLATALHSQGNHVQIE